MIKEGEEFAERIRSTFYRQKVAHIGCRDGRLAPLFPFDSYVGVDFGSVETARNNYPEYSFRAVSNGTNLATFGDVAFTYDYLRALPPEAVQGIAGKLLGVSRLVAFEYETEFRGVRYYSKLLSGFFRLHRCTFCRIDGGPEITVMDFFAERSR